MDGLAILQEAERAGLRLHVEGDKLVIQGPREAEPIVRRLAECKGEVMAALAGSGGWRLLFDSRRRWWLRAGYAESEARRLAWSAMATDWHVEHGEPVPRDRCAGCGKPLDDAEVIDLWPHGERAHAEPEYRCIIAYGRRWRAAAAAALASCGIATPPEIAAEIGKEDDGRAA